MRKFGIKTDDRRRHTYVIGKTGMGKTTLLENMILSDIYAGHGACYVDPHGDTAEKLLDYIPSWRINDVVYFNPADVQYPVGFNILESVDDEMKHLVAAGMMGVFKKIWENVWSARMEYILNNTILALLDNPGSTLLGINRVLSDKDYRKEIISNVKDPIVRQFWVKEFAQYQDKFATEAVAPIQNKVGQFLSASIVRNIVAQAQSTINIRKIMDEEKILIINLSKGRIGEDASRLLGGMIITKIQMSAMERVDTPEADRADFYLYVDEFQNFAVESFASILSEARKYRLNLIMAHQYIAQLTEEVRDAVFGNVGTIISFRVGSPDAVFMEDEFMPRFTPEDIINLPKFSIYLKLMIDGVTSQPFSAATLAPIAHRTDSEQKVITQSRERYSIPREKIEEHVVRWSGFGGDDIDMEKEFDSALKEAKEKRKEKYKHNYNCTRCNKEFGLPVELDRSRPIYCDDCMPIIKEERAKSKSKPKGGRGGSSEPRSSDRKGDRKREEPKKSEPKLPPVQKVSDGELVVDQPKATISLDSLKRNETRSEKKAPEAKEPTITSEQTTALPAFKASEVLHMEEAPKVDGETESRSEVIQREPLSSPVPDPTAPKLERSESIERPSREVPQQRSERPREERVDRAERPQQEAMDPGSEPGMTRRERPDREENRTSSPSFSDPQGELVRPLVPEARGGQSPADSEQRPASTQSRNDGQSASAGDESTKKRKRKRRRRKGRGEGGEGSSEVPQERISLDSLKNPSQNNHLTANQARANSQQKEAFSQWQQKSKVQPPESQPVQQTPKQPNDHAPDQLRAPKEERPKSTSVLPGQVVTFDE